MSSIEAFVSKIPKAELHLHIEGTLEPEMAFELARKHGVSLRYPSVEARREAYRFTDLQSFLDLYYAGAEVLRDEGDFRALTSAYLRRAAADGVVHVEIFFDPQTHTSRRVPFDAVIGGIRGALAEGHRALGITHRLILCYLRHLSADDAMRALEQALLHGAAIAAVGFVSAYGGIPPGYFAAVYVTVRAVGFRSVSL